MPHKELSTLWTHNFGKISFPKKEDNKEIYKNCIYLCNDDDQSGQTIPSKICQIKILKHHTDNQLVFYAYLQKLHELAVLAHLIISFCSENF